MIHATTVVAVRRDGRLAMGSDGQVTQESVILKHGAQKVRRLAGGRVLAGFAGSVADALTLFEKFEGHLQQTGGRLARAAVELAKEWRTDRVLRRLEALMLVGDLEGLLVISGGGEVIEPDEPIMAIGSGGPYALAAGRALLRNTSLDAEQIVRQALGIASEICIYTNDRITVEELG
ncbi:MAG: ATP-dependent protease subunit HslV [Bacillota bacterium]|nr:ATP-dependent protease subunit HslV [Bacillota bacterium]